MGAFTIYYKTFSTLTNFKTLQFPAYYKTAKGAAKVYRFTRTTKFNQTATFYKTLHYHNILQNLYTIVYDVS